ncbi:family 78 glycoside hydrolase catalytic domain [Isoptericola sp. b441]|uniref:alpha-L-rhamnosidase n=1 Tax=Actinotalea lenta TaxID=3064654 RepID=A0ABT9DC51_9CELL|nr:family 78 glycoside hydrolase catalytic domain [Isoptericola sp. b441]MDO8108081.1 family 78 glycoside hydrolase catalytic domain [Isoptericola sp. b441]
MPAVTRLRAEHVTDGVVGVRTPRLSWQVVTTHPGWVQTACQLRVRPVGPGDGSAARCWREAARVESADQVLVAWPFDPLAPRDRVEVAVRVWGPDGASEWSDPLGVEAGLLERDEWSARLVQPPRTGDDRCAYLRREFDAEEVVSARLYATAQGVYECRLNGVPVGPDRLAPGWTSYRHRLRYQVHDVTTLVRAGANALAVRLADGWCAGRLGWWRGGLRHLYADRTGVVVQLELTYADGTVRTVTTDGAWRAGRGGIAATSFYDGETYVADDEPEGWELPGFDDAAWAPVDVADLPDTELVGPQLPSIRVTGSMAVRAWLTSPSGATIADFGQVLTGHVRLRLRGSPGSVVTLRFAEVLDAGELARRPQRTAANTDRVALGASGELDWEPTFTVRSFRYAEVDDPGGVVVRDEVVGRTVRNDLARTGWFECSDPELDRLHENAVWGIADNMLDVPTDCMLRDERLGWIGDAAHVARAAGYLYDMAGFHDSWLADLALDQRPNGSPTMVVPAIDLEPFPGDYPVAVFGDAACMAPAAAYERYGDLALLRRQLPSMAAWARCVGAETLAGFPTPGFQFGDWLDPTAPPDNPENGLTEYDVVMALGAVRSAALALDAARAVGDEAVEREMDALHADLLAYVDRVYVTADGLVAGDSQTAYALALHVGALPPAKRQAAFARLVLLLRRRGRLQAGYPGTYALMDVLVDGGRADLAYRLLDHAGVPSWRYAVRLGATTFWERWDSLLADGSLNPGDMLSFNHPVFASITDWLHRVVGGLAPAAPGYRRLRVAPLPGGGLTWVRTAHETPYGRAEVAWRLTDEFRLDVLVPPGTSADVVLPGDDAVRTVGSGAHTFTCPAAQVPVDTDTGPWGAHAHV